MLDWWIRSFESMALTGLRNHMTRRYQGARNKMLVAKKCLNGAVGCSTYVHQFPMSSSQVIRNKIRGARVKIVLGCLSSLQWRTKNVEVADMNRQTTTKWSDLRRHRWSEVTWEEDKVRMMLTLMTWQRNKWRAGC